MPTHSHPSRRPAALAAVAAVAVAALALGIFSTLGDWVWALYIPDGAVVPGIVHGLLFFVLIAIVLGAAVGSARVVRRLLLALPAAGLLLAAAFYPLAGALGYLGSLLATWVGMWLSLAFALRWARGADESAGRSLVRGLVAAVTSGLAFWSVSGMWTAPAEATGYPLRLVYWTFAFLPGLAALLLARAESSRGTG